MYWVRFGIHDKDRGRRKKMRTSVKGLTMTCALLWGGCMLLVGLINLADASYGGEFLRMMSSVYPGADTARTLGRVLLGTVYGFVDGGVAGWIFAMLFNAFNSPSQTHIGSH
jgi:hypothetical protein